MRCSGLYVLINARETPDPIAAAEAVLRFVEDNNIERLNVAGAAATTVGWSTEMSGAMRSKSPLGLSRLVIR
jgi:hypothetical protein